MEDRLYDDVISAIPNQRTFQANSKTEKRDRAIRDAMKKFGLRQVIAWNSLLLQKFEQLLLN